MPIYIATLFCIEKWRQPQCSLVDEEVNKVCTCDGILFSLKKDGNTVRCCKMAKSEDTMLSETTKPQKTNAAGFTYLVYLKSHICGDRKVEWWLPVVEVMGKQGVIV